MVFYKNISDLAEKIMKLSRDEKLRKNIGKKGKLKYMEFFNSTLVSNYIINKSLNVNDKNKYLWEKNWWIYNKNYKWIDT